MKKILAVLGCFVVFVSFTMASEEGNTYSYSYARLSYVKGDVFIQRAQDLGYEEGVVNLPVVEGDKLGTREGQAEIHFGKRNYLRINRITQIDLITLPRKDENLIKIHLLSGNIYLRIDYLEEEKGFEIHTPDASFYILEEGLYRVDVLEDRETTLFVFEGFAEAAGEEGSLLVEENQKLVVSSGYFTSDPYYFGGSLEDDFSLWNSSRETLYARTVSKKYLPPELDEYEVELASNGRWVHEQPYGNVWVPYVSHNVWRPYYYGRWIWYPIIGWTWVSYDPWGWCVYRYGRWHWRLGLGWYWIPNRIWGPAWVHWYMGYDYIGWCPLGYYGYPVVIMNNRFFGRYNGRYFPANSRSLVVVHKNNLQARRISRAALSRNRVSRIGKISLSPRPPGVKPIVKKASFKNKMAAKVLSRSHLRGVRKAYGAGKAVSPSRSRSITYKKSSHVPRRTVSEEKNRSILKRSSKISSSRSSSRTLKIYPSRSSRRKSKASKGSRSSSTIRTYPSKRTPSSSPRKKKNLSSGNNSRSSSRTSSSVISSRRTKVKTNSQSKRSSRSVPSTLPSVKRNKRSYSTSSRISRISKARSSAKSGASRKSYSSSPKRSSRSKSVSSRSRKISSSKSSSSRARVSRSSKRSSSSRSSSIKKIKKR